MKKIIHIISLCVLIISLGGLESAFSQGICTLSIPGSPNLLIKLDSSEIRSGVPFQLSFSAGNTSAGNCGTDTIEVHVTGNLQYLPPNPGSSTPQMTAIGANRYRLIMTSSEDMNFQQQFRFPAGVTCNGEKATLRVIKKNSCGKDSCDRSITAKASNYWQVSKEHFWGNMAGGNVVWKITIQNTNPSPGIGDYNIHSMTFNDVINTGQIVSISPAVTTTPALPSPGNTTSWTTGTISSSIHQMVYYVTTTTCAATGTLVRNCIRWNMNLGREISLQHEEAVSSDKGTLSRQPAPLRPTPARFFCDKQSGESCDTVRLTDPNLRGNFSKVLINQSNINFAQGCEGEYLISFTNPGNVPLGNIQINDVFPSGIDVTQIRVYGSELLQYTIGVNGNSATHTATMPGTFIVPVPPSGSFTDFSFQSLSGALQTGVIQIFVRFTVTDPAGSIIQNCATADFQGEVPLYGGNCQHMQPIDQTGQGPVQSCVRFQVDTAKPVMGIRKCQITSGPYEPGQQIRFTLLVTNNGQGSFTGSVSDLLGSPQKLKLVPGSVKYYSSVSDGYPSCHGNSALMSTTPPSFVVPDLSNDTLPKWQLNNMPGDCRYNHYSYVLIEFEAEVQPGALGNYINTGSLYNSSGGLIGSSTSPYTVQRVGKLNRLKTAKGSSDGDWGVNGYSEPGEPFQFKLSLQNTGNVAFHRISLTDALPACVSCNGIASVRIYDVQNTASNLTYSGGLSGCNLNITLPAGQQLKPGEELEVILSVTMNADQRTACCNEKFSYSAEPVDQADFPITSFSNEACVTPSICCQIEDFEVRETGPYVLGSGIVNGNLIINAGNIPIQELSVSLTDIDVIYNQKDCHPGDLGDQYTHLSSTQTTVNGLPRYLVPGAPAHTGNELIWKGSNPAVMNPATVSYTIKAPALPYITCCEATVVYCLKIRVKDANCNVCEKKICLRKPIRNIIRNPATDAGSVIDLNQQKRDNVAP